VCSSNRLAARSLKFCVLPNLVRDVDGGEVIDIVPEGASGEDFASRPNGQKVSHTEGA
jgi:hypothetical protein